MAEDYISELEAWTDNDYYENNVTKIQLPYNAAVCILRFFYLLFYLCKPRAFLFVL